MPAPIRPPRVYADTSVYGGVFDPEFAAASRAFFGAVRRGRFTLVTSELVRAEIHAGPTPIASLYRSMLPWTTEIAISAAARQLSDAYLASQVLPVSQVHDALHVAVATVAGCLVIVSWNFRHLVNIRRSRLYNAVNVLNGYGEIVIASPPEVVQSEEEV